MYLIKKKFNFFNFFNLEIKFGQQNSINQVSNDQPGTSAFLDNNDIRIQHNDHQDDSSQPITSLVHQEAVANITSELEHSRMLIAFKKCMYLINNIIKI